MTVTNPETSRAAVDATLVPVGELLTGEDTYRVPIYQRNYAWQAPQIEQLLDDITDARRNADPSYFLGNLVVTGAPRPGGGLVFDVVDGQQRLTTLYLLLTALSSGTSGAAVSRGALSYESRPKAAAALLAAGRGDDGWGLPGAPAMDTDAGITEGLNVIRQYLRRRVGEEDRTGLDRYVRECVRVARTALPDGTDLNRYFEVMNTRGQQLEQVDIVKARLMSRLSDDPVGRSAFARIWDACAEMDVYVQLTLTSGEPGLRDRLFGETWTWLQVRGWEGLRTALSSGSAAPAAVTTRPAEGMDLDRALRHYAAGTDGRSDDDEDEPTRFQSPIGFPTFLLHALKLVGPTGPDDSTREDEQLLDDKKLIDRFDRAFRDASAAQVGTFAADLLDLRNLFDAFVLKRQFTARTGEDGDWSLQRLVKQRTTRLARGRVTTSQTAGYRNTFPLDVHAGETDDADTDTRTLLLLQSMLRVTYTSPRTMHWMTLLLRHLRSASPEETTAAALEELLRQYAREQVRRAFPEQHEPEGFDTPRIVFTYLDYLLLQERGSDTPGSRFTFRNSIEHFYPQNPDQEQHGAAVSADMRDRLGNLALVSVHANSKFSNSLPAAKAVNFSRMLAQSPKLAEMGRLAGTGPWDDDAVDRHHRRMVGLLRDDLA